MIPYSDGIPARRFPVVNTALIVANFAVFLLYELPNGDAAVNQASFYPCDVDNSCHLGIPWGVSWITAMFMHAGWDHILGNMLFLVIFGKNVEDAFGRLGYLAFYLAGGLAATIMQTAMTLLGWFPIRIPAWIFLGGWFLYQFFEGNYGLVHPDSTGGSGVAFFAHVGGFVFGVLVAIVLTRAGRITAKAVR